LAGTGKEGGLRAGLPTERAGRLEHQHELATNDPTFAEHRASVQVVVEPAEVGKAHNTMTALKIPKGDPGDKPLPRFRSNVDGDKSNLEQRDVSEPETTKVRAKPVVDQVAGFAREDGRQDVTQNTAAHEAGHMFGLDDEYVEEDAPAGVAKKFTGDRPAHFGDVQAELGDDAAEEMRNQDSGSIMSRGAEVKRGHYVPFLQAVERATSKQWTVT
jgi:hypothetical protein